VLLEVLDRKWREHLYEMDYLQEGIGLRGYGQRDPLIEYQREAFDMFNGMMDGIKEEAVGFLFYVQVNVEALSGQEAAAVDGGEVPQLPISDAAVGGEVSELETATAAVGGEAQEPPTASVAEGGHAPTAAPVSLEKQSVADVIGKAIGAPSHAPATNLQYSAPSVDGEATVQRRTEPAAGSSAAGTAGGASFANASRNAPCPCGSGRKYKRCHGAPTNPAG
jgi:preprotein translocase subunit SecA